MTEEEWLDSDRLNFLFAGLRSAQPGLRTNRGKRKFRLFANQCVRRLPSLSAHEKLLGVLDLYGKYLDGELLREEVAAFWNGLRYGVEARSDGGRPGGVLDRLFHTDTVWSVTVWKWLTETSYGADIGQWSTPPVDPKDLCTILRDIFGNPFRPVSFEPERRTSTVVSLAKSMYESRDFSAMPILSDALQNAGCEHADILDHCRGSGPHVRGCWVVDLVLGKS